MHRRARPSRTVPYISCARYGHGCTNLLDDFPALALDGSATLDAGRRENVPSARTSFSGLGQPSRRPSSRSIGRSAGWSESRSSSVPLSTSPGPYPRHYLPVPGTSSTSNPQRGPACRNSHVRAGRTGASSLDAALQLARASRAPKASSNGRLKPSNQGAEEQASTKPRGTVCVRALPFRLWCLRALSNT